MTYITQLDGRGWNQVDDADKDRATAAADAVCAAAGVTPAAAYTAYQAQWIEFDDEAPMTGAARVWVDAQRAADVALTETWATPGADVFCVIAA